MNFEALIGLEIHIQMKTKSKMFSSAPVTFGEEANTCVAPLDIAFPGTMPSVNKQVVINAIRLCHALNMDIDHEIWFDRKNYFYSDLAKGYQITQHRRPIGKNGYLSFNINGEDKKLYFDRLQIEEDTCKQLHFDTYTLLDYNRSGIPLLEIVSKPNLKNGEEAKRCVEKIRSYVTFLGISSGRMEEGSLRCDVNVSVRPFGSNILPIKTEIKNVNTLNNIKQAIDFEINRQQKLLLSGQRVRQETLRFDEVKKETVSMRIKTDDDDYKYFVDANLIPIILDDKFIEETIKTSPELAESKYIRYIKLGIKDKIALQILSDYETSIYFDETISHDVNPIKASNWLVVELKSYLNKNNLSIGELSFRPIEFASFLKAIEENNLSHKDGEEILIALLNNKSDLKTLIDNKKIDQYPLDKLNEIVDLVLNNNPQSIIDYKNGKNRVLGFLVGQVIKYTNGKANPEVVNKLISNKLKER